MLQVLGVLIKLELGTKVTPAALMEAAKSLHDTEAPSEEHVSRAGALLHQLNVLAQHGRLPSMSVFGVVCALCYGHLQDAFI